MMFWKKNDVDRLNAIREGAMFQRLHANNLTETARILAVAEDQFGIPHVKYEVKFERAQERGRSFEGPRVLALSVFADNYNHMAEAV